MDKDMTSQSEDDKDSEMMMDHICKEAIHAVHSHDHESFKNSMRAMFDMHKSTVDQAEDGDY